MERSGELTSLLRRFGNQNFEFASMPFHELREVFRTVELGPGDLFCDAGAGYGHAVFYGACIAESRFRAIEILPARCAAMRRTAARLGLTNVEIIQADAIAHLTQGLDGLAGTFQIGDRGGLGNFDQGTRGKLAALGQDRGQHAETCR